ncbi:MAG: hypothetical protein HN348_16710 [Proteobacteria bacterium]|nr:hypothetical protein [Pseudomonadota bacterium]
MMTGLGRAWVTDTLAFKKYPACAYVDTTLDALFKVLGAYRDSVGHHIRLDEVVDLKVEANLLTVEMDNLSAAHQTTGPLNPIRINFSIPHNVAIAIVANQHTSAQLGRPFLDKKDASIRRLASKVRLTHDWAMTAEVIRAYDGVPGLPSATSQLGLRDLHKILRGYRTQMGGPRNTSLALPKLFRHPMLIRLIGGQIKNRSMGQTLTEVDFSAFKAVFPSRVTLRALNGRFFSALQDIPKGAPGQEGIAEVVEDKFRLEASTHLPAPQLERVLELLRRVDETPVAEVARLSIGTNLN